MKDNVNGKLFFTYHKPWRVFNDDHIKNLNVGRECIERTKDGILSVEDLKWLEYNTIGDNIGDNISIRNREFCECTGLYWIWKNIDIYNLDYIGIMQYRRQLILNDCFEKHPDDLEKIVYKCIHFSKDKKDLINTIGLKDDIIVEIMSQFDCIIPHPSELDKMKITNIYDDWVSKIPGVHIDDLIILDEVFTKKYPNEADLFREYLLSDKKYMYQIFIAKPVVFNDYCSWLFDLLFDIDKLIDTSLYTINGKRTIGYLAEILYGYYFYKMKVNSKYKILETGVTFLE